MKTLYDPSTIAAVTTGLQAVGSAANAFGAGRAKGDYYDQMADQERKAHAREARDLEKTKRATLARSLALMAANGGGAGDPSSTAVLMAQAAEFGIKAARQADDSATRVASLTTRAKNERRAGTAAAMDAIFGGAAKVGKILKKKPTSKGNSNGANYMSGWEGAYNPRHAGDYK